MMLYVALTVAVIGVLGMQVNFKGLVDLEFTHFPEAWRADGKPVAGKESRKHASFLWSGFSTWACFHEWIFKSPYWATSNPGAEVLLFRMRIWGAVFATGVLILLWESLPLLGVIWGSQGPADQRRGAGEDQSRKTVFGEAGALSRVR